MNPEEKKLLQETYQLTKENNAMLHSSRRWAFIHAIIKWTIYLALIGFPLYYFVNNVLPMLNTGVEKLNDVQKAIGKVQGATQNVGGQFNELNNLLQKAKEAMSTSDSTPTSQ